MAESKCRIARIKQPRYSLLDLVLFLLLATGGMTIGALWILCGQVRFWQDQILSSPLPEILLAPTPGVPGAKIYSKEYEFHQDWVTRNLPIWETALEPFKGQPGVKYLEIGVYEGASLIWMLEHVLTHPSARATAVDIFAGPYKETYSRNIRLSEMADKVTTITGLSQVVLRQLPLDSFDVIYIDGSHAKNDVLEDAVLSWRLLKNQGLMIFDDYLGLTGAGSTTFECPKMGIDPFIQCFQDQFQVIHNGRQLMVERRKGPQEIKLLDVYAPTAD